MDERIWVCPTCYSNDFGPAAVDQRKGVWCNRCGEHVDPIKMNWMEAMRMRYDHDTSE